MADEQGTKEEGILTSEEQADELMKLTKKELVDLVMGFRAEPPAAEAVTVPPDKIVVARYPFYKLMQAMIQNQLGQSHMGHAALSKFKDLMGLPDFATAQVEWSKIRAILKEDSCRSR